MAFVFLIDIDIEASVVEPREITVMRIEAAFASKSVNVMSMTYSCLPIVTTYRALLTVMPVSRRSCFASVHHSSAIKAFDEETSPRRTIHVILNGSESTIVPSCCRMRMQPDAAV